MTTYKFTVADHAWSHEFNVEAVDHNEAIQLIGWALRSFSEFPEEESDVLKRIERLESIASGHRHKIHRLNMRMASLRAPK